MKEIISAVVIGGIHHNTLGVIRSLGSNKLVNFSITLLLVDENAKKKNFVSASKYVRKRNVFIIKNNDALIETLLSISSDGIKRVVICCSDGSAETVIAAKDQLQKFYYCPSTKLNIRELMSKSCQFEIAEKVGFNLPQTKIINKDKLNDWCLFPCITKPEKSVYGAGKADIQISKNEEEFKNALDNTLAEQIFVQEFIDKKMEYQLIGCSLNGGEKIIIPGYTRMIRQPYNTNTGYLEYIPIENLVFNYDSVVKFIQEIGYSGLFSLEFLRDKNDKDFFLEINMRNDGNAFCVKSAGINLPLIWCYYQVHKEMPSVKLNFKKPLRFIPEFPDFKIGVKEVGVFKWLFQFIGAKSHAVLNARDPKPFFSKLFNYRKRRKK